MSCVWPKPEPYVYTITTTHVEHFGCAGLSAEVKKEHTQETMAIQSAVAVVAVADLCADGFNERAE